MPYLLSSSVLLVLYIHIRLLLWKEICDVRIPTRD